jgi:hypothetical protein
MPKSGSRFRTGRTGGCESVLFEVTEWNGASDQEKHIKRFAAESMRKVIAYLHRRDPEFRILSVQQVRLVVLLFGTPLN